MCLSLLDQSAVTSRVTASTCVWPQLKALLPTALQTMYKQSKKRFDEDPEFKERARKAVTQLQGGDAQFITAWERICEASRKVCNDFKQWL